MTAEGCREWRERIGALVLGQLGPTERAATEAHLEGCASCRAEAESLAPLAPLLSKADPERLTPSPAPPARLGDRIARRIAAERRAARRRRVRLGLALGAAATAVAAALLLAVILGGSGSAAPSRTVAFRGLPAGVSANASLTSRAWGSDVAIRVRGFRPGTLCKVWLRRANGDRIPAGSFRYVYDGESDEAKLSAALVPSDATAIGLRAGDRTYVAPLAARGPRSGAARIPPSVAEGA
jgi:Putative zinc-finger